MVEELWVQNPWLGMAVWAALYISDYSLTIYAARLRQAGVKEHLVYEGSYELTPLFQKDVDRLRRFSPRFILVLILSSMGIVATWWLAVRAYSTPQLFALLLGALILPEGAIHVRHLRNLFLFHSASKPGILKGRIEYSHQLMLKLSAVELVGFAALFLLVSFLSGSWFALGGMAECLVIAANHWTRAGKTSPQPEPG